MKQQITALSMCQTMFCRIPFPLKKWEEGARPFLLLFLPVIGLEIGVLWYLADLVLRHLVVPAPVYGFVMTAVPILLTGGIHLDGFMDVADAIGSWRDLEKRRAILKDSHVGAVAVIWVVFLLLGYFAVFSSVTDGKNAGCLILIPVVSRCCSSLAVWQLKSMSTSQYADQQKPKAHIHVHQSVCRKHNSRLVQMVCLGTSDWFHCCRISVLRNCRPCHRRCRIWPVPAESLSAAGWHERRYLRLLHPYQRTVCRCRTDSSVR